MNTKVTCPNCNDDIDVIKHLRELGNKEYIEIKCKNCTECLIVYKKMNPILIAHKHNEVTCSNCKNITINPKTKDNSELFPKHYKGTNLRLCKSCWMIMLYEEFFLQK